MNGVRRAVAAIAAAIALFAMAAPAGAITSPEALRNHPAGPVVGQTHKSPPVSTPQAPDAPAQAQGTVEGRIRIPAIGVERPILAGVSLDVLARGVGHWVGTARPGGLGNVVLAGHRTTHGAPFYNLDRLRPGDLIYLTNPQGREVPYRVTETFIVQPQDVWIVNDIGEPIVTLFACHPKGSVAQRIVVRAEMVELPAGSEGVA